MSGQFGDPLLFLVRTLFELVIFVILLRYFLQLFRGNFFNPLTQSIVKITNPLLQPLRRVLPQNRRHDFAALLVAAVLTVLMVVTLGALSPGGVPGGAAIGMMSLYFAFLMVTNLFFWIVLLRALSSWLGNSGSPAVALLADLTDPLLAPVQKILPPLGGLDLSPLVLLLGIQVVQMVIGNVLFG